MTAASRRSVLAALAAAPVAGVPGMAGVADAGEPDPCACRSRIRAAVAALTPAERAVYEEFRKIMKEEMERLGEQ